jgi:opacity protein-like surface antigen
VFKFHPPRSGRVLPYGLIGAGVHRSSLDWRFHPAPGSSVTGSGSLVQDTAINYALAVAGGADIDLDGRWFIGVEGRGNYLGSSTYQATALGNQAAVNSITTGQFTFNFLAHLGVRFGSPPMVPLQLP